MNIQLKKGVMEIVVLSMLRRRDFYGYELVSEISKYQASPTLTIATTASPSPTRTNTDIPSMTKQRQIRRKPRKSKKKPIM